MVAAALPSGAACAADSTAPSGGSPASATATAGSNDQIVPDAVFDKSLPPVGDTLDAPLAPIDQYDRSAGAPQIGPPIGPRSGSGPVARPAIGISGSAPASPAAGDDLPPVPSPSADLFAPLPALGSYDTTPPLAVADVADQKQVVLRYDTRVAGLDQVGLTGQFEAFSALRHGGGKAANATMVSARAHEDEELAVRLLKAAGYYDASAVATIETPTQTPTASSGSAASLTSRLRATITANAGRRYTLGSIAVSAPQTVPPDLITHALTIKVGDPIEAVRIEGAEANVSLLLPQQGYPFVKLGQRDILLDDAAATGAYILPVDPGPRASFGGYTATGKLAFDADHVGVLARFERGDLYDNRKVDDLRSALIATSLFRTVSVEPVRTTTPGPNGTEQVDLLVREEAGPPRSLAVSGGYSTGEGIRLEGSFTHRNLFPPEGALILNALAGTQEQGFGTTFRRSNAGRRDRTVTFAGAVDHATYNAFNAFTGTLSGRISYDSTPIWQKKLTYAYGFELTGTNESVYDFSRAARRRATYFIAALPAQAQFDRSDNLLNPTRGYRLKISLSPEGSVRGAVRPYLRSLVEASAYFPVGHALVLAGRIRAGSITGIARDDLAPSRRYYGGGGGSVRGFGYQELGPRDPTGAPIGGRSINEAAVEARYRFGNFGIVPFLDVGQSYAASLPTGRDLRFGAGIGGRFYTNFGPFRVDVATPLARRPGEAKVALYISIGQAF